MHQFDILINEVLGGLAKAAATTARTAGAFLRASENPSELGKTFGEYQTAKEKALGQIYTIQNQPKLNSWAIYVPQPEITAIIKSKVDENGQFEVTLAKPDRKPPYYSFVKTQKNPKWRIEENDIISRNEFAAGKAKDPVLVENDPKTGRAVRQQFITMIVGKRTKFPEWSSYEAYIKAEK